MKWILGIALNLFLFAVTPAFAQSGYAGPYAPHYTIVEPQTVTCRILDENTGKIREERMENLQFLEIIQTCESGAIAFIVPTTAIEQVAGDPPNPLSEQEDKN